MQLGAAERTRPFDLLINQSVKDYLPYEQSVSKEYSTSNFRSSLLLLESGSGLCKSMADSSTQSETVISVFRSKMTNVFFHCLKSITENALNL
jgi:hypothetical protein